MRNSSSPPKTPVLAQARAEGASGSDTRPFCLGDPYLFPEAGEGCTLGLFSGHGTVLQDTSCAILLMRWAIPLGYFQESGSGLTLLISGEAGKLETAEHPDPGSPQVGQEQQDGSAAENREQRDAHPALAALIITRGTRTQPSLRSRADTGV